MEVTGLLRTLRMPRWRLALRCVGVALAVAIGILLGLPSVFLVPIGLLLVWGFWYDFSHKPRGGWRPAPMGSYAVTNDVDPAFLINERGDAGVDQTGRTYATHDRDPTPEQVAAMGAEGLGGLAAVAVEVVVFAVLLLLVILLRRSET